MTPIVYNLFMSDTDNLIKTKCVCIQMYVSTYLFEYVCKNLKIVGVSMIDKLFCPTSGFIYAFEYLYVLKPLS